MTLIELIDAAKRKQGTLGTVAAGLGVHQNRLGDWKNGRRKPDAHEIAYLAKCAELPVLETVAEIESQMDERYSEIWKAALEKLRAAGVTAGIALILQAGLVPENSYANQQVIPVFNNSTSYTSWKVNDTCLPPHVPRSAPFFRRQASEQYLTSSQFLAQLRRQVIGNPHATHALLGSAALLPRCLPD